MPLFPPVVTLTVETGQPPADESHLQKSEYQNLVTYRKDETGFKHLYL